MKHVTPSTAMKVGKSGLPSVDNFDYETTGTHQTDTHVAPPASTRRLPARPMLTIVEGADAGRVVVIDKGEVVIGRATDCGVVLPDAGVSRRHARVLVRDHDFVLEDLQSKNGTFVDGQAVTTRPLAVTEVFHVGPNVKIRLSLMDESEERLARQLYDSSMRDALTTVYNRRYFIQRLIGELAFAIRHSTPLSVIVLDLDHFKKVNDTHGHAVGDLLLQAVARAVNLSLRSEDVLARVGGEEFAVLLRGTGHREAMIVAERIRGSVAFAKITAEELEVCTTVSAGVATTAELAQGELTHEKLVGLADERLYAAKEAGRNLVCGS